MSLGDVRELCRAHSLNHWQPQLADTLGEHPGYLSKSRQLISKLPPPPLFLGLVLEVRALPRVRAQLHAGIGQLLCTK